MNLSLNQGVNVLVAILITPYLFQTLGEEKYGLVSVALTIILLFGMLVNYGFNLNIPKKLALVRDNRIAKEQLINEVLTVRVLIAIALIVVLWVFIEVFGFFRGYSIILLFSAVQLLNDSIYPLFILQGFDRLSWIAKANAISKLGYLGLVLLIVTYPAEAYWVNFLLGGTGFLVHLILLVFIYKVESIKYSWVSLHRVNRWLISNFQFFSSTVASYILINGGFIVLKSFVSGAELGFYALAQRVVILLRMIPIFIAQSVLQNASRLYQKDKSAFEEYLKKSQRNGMLITFLVCTAMAFTSKWVVRVLAGEYIELSANIMAILCSLPVLSMINISNMIRILVAEQKYILSKAVWITTILMIVLSLLGSYYYGSYGLAFALVVAEVFNYFINRYLIKKTSL